MEELLHEVLFAAEQGYEKVVDQGAAAVEVKHLRPARDVASDNAERGQAREPVRAGLVIDLGGSRDVTADHPLGRRKQCAKHGHVA
jgi:hypothetical protein